MISSRTTLRDRISALAHRRATWVLADQGIVSAGNFLMASFLAKFLSKAQFGTFGVAWETILYLNSLQAALINYPLTVKGAMGDRTNLGRLATASIFLTVAMLPMLGVAIAFWLGAMETWHVALTALPAMVLWQLQETLRRALMSHLRFAETVIGDAISYLGQAAIVYALGRAGKLDLNLAMIVMALTSAAALAIQALQIGLQKVHLKDLRIIMVDFWRMGRWMLLTNAAGAICGVGYIWTLRWSNGAEACAVFFAVALLFKLVNPVTNSMSGLITPVVARLSATESMHAATRAALRYGGLCAIPLVPYFLLLLIFPGTALHLAADEKYVDQTLALRLFVVNAIVVYILAMSGSWLAGLGRARYSFYMQVVNVIGTLLVGMPMTIKYGAIGLILGGVVASGMSAIAGVFLIRHAIRHPIPDDHSPGSL